MEAIRCETICWGHSNESGNAYPFIVGSTHSSTTHGAANSHAAGPMNTQKAMFVGPVPIRMGKEKPSAVCEKRSAGPDRAKMVQLQYA